MFDREQLHALRRAELETALTGLDLSGKRVLEIGAGDGYLAAELAREVDVTAVDVAACEGKSWFPVTIYDGRILPFEDGSFDFLMSFHVLEHIPHLDAFHAEMHRVLKPGGCALHIVPSASWRIYTMLAHYPALPGIALWKLSRHGNRRDDKAIADIRPPSGVGDLLAKVLVASRHGESGTALTEAFHLTARIWKRKMERGGWTVAKATPCGMFYSGYGLAGTFLPPGWRRRLARVLGSSSTALYLTQQKPTVPAAAA